MFRENRVARFTSAVLRRLCGPLNEQRVVAQRPGGRTTPPSPPASDSPPATALETPTLRVGQYVGAATCASGTCHGSVEPRDLYKVKQNEYFIWLKQDRHTQAYNVLLTDKSARIMRNLKIRTKAQESKICLDCHAMNVPKSAQATPIDVAEGISCEACHGPAGGWLAQHYC